MTVHVTVGSWPKLVAAVAAAALAAASVIGMVGGFARLDRAFNDHNTRVSGVQYERP
jgi:hypothetical protein